MPLFRLESANHRKHFSLECLVFLLTCEMIFKQLKDVIINATNFRNLRIAKEHLYLASHASQSLCLSYSQTATNRALLALSLSVKPIFFWHAMHLAII
jgi:hypothetical protein